MSCTCESGQKEQFCKHRWALPVGNSDSLISPNAAELLTLAGIFAGTEAQQRFQSVIDLEKQQAEINEKLKSEKEP